MPSFKELAHRLKSLSRQKCGEKFEGLVKHYLTSLPDRFDQVWLWDEWPGCDAPDTGIDLVARDTRTRGLVAIQAKAIDRSLTKSDLNSFVAETTRRRSFSTLIVVTTAQGLSANAQKLVDELPIELHARDSLATAQIRWPDRLPASSRRWWPFTKARAFARKLRLRNHEEWLRYSASGKRPPQVPANPQVTYSKAGTWTDWGDFLGTGNQRSKSWQPFAQARDFARGLKLQSEGAWRRFVKSPARPPDIPTNPSTVYSSHWLGWPDWLGTQPRQHWKSYKLAARFAQSLGLAKAKDWRAYVRSHQLPLGIPRSPYSVYRHRGWTSWGDFLGSSNIAPSKRTRMPYEEAADLVRKLGITSSAEFRRYCRSGSKPANLPANPDRAYAAAGWTSWGCFLGTNRTASSDHEWLAFPDARRLARGLGISSRREWRTLASSGTLPEGVPCCPDEVYRESGWRGWKDWLSKECAARTRKRNGAAQDEP